MNKILVIVLILAMCFIVEFILRKIKEKRINKSLFEEPEEIDTSDLTFPEIPKKKGRKND